MTTIRSNYSAANTARVDRVRGTLERAEFQNDAVMRRVRELEKQAPPPVVTPPKPPPAPPVVTWGDHMGINAGPIPSAAAIDKTVALGLKWVQCSPEYGWNYTPGMIQELVDRIHARGLNVAVAIQNNGHRYDAPTIAAELGNYAATWAKAKADAILCLNEPNNTPAFFNPADPQMTLTANICRQILDRVRAVDPDVPVYLPGWSPSEFMPVDAQRLLGQALTLIGSHVSRFSGPGHHPYCFTNPLTHGVAEGQRKWNAFLQTSDVWEAAKAQGNTGGMCLSEFGCPSVGTSQGWTFTEQGQRDNLRDTFAGFTLMRATGIKMDYLGLSTAIDGEAASRTLEESMGVYRADGTEKPAAAIVREQAAKPW